MYDIGHYVLPHVTAIMVTWHLYMILVLNRGCMEAYWVSTLSFTSPFHCWTDIHSLTSPIEMPPRLSWALCTLFPYNKLSCLSQALLCSLTILMDHLCTLHGCHYEVLCYSIRHLGNSHQSKGWTPVSCPLHIFFRPLKAHLNILLHKLY